MSLFCGRHAPTFTWRPISVPSNVREMASEGSVLTGGLTHTHTRAHTHTHTHTHTHPHAHPRTRTPTRTHTCTPTRTHTHTHSVVFSDSFCCSVRSMSNSAQSVVGGGETHRTCCIHIYMYTYIYTYMSHTYICKLTKDRICMI